MARIELNIVALGDFASVNTQIKALQTQVVALNKSVAGVGLSTQLTKDLNAAQAAFKATMLSTGQFTVQTVRMTSETAKFGEALVAGKLKLSDYFNIITGKSSQATASLKALAMEQVKLQSSLVMADPAKRGLLSVYTPTTINAVTSATKLATMQQDLYNMSVMASSKALITWGKNTQWAGRQLTVGLTMPMVMFGAAAVKSFKDTNTELTRLQRLYGVGLVAPSNKDIAAISTQVLDLGKKLAESMGTAQKDTAATAADFAAIGRTGPDLLTSTEQAMRLSKLGSIDAHTAFTGIMSLQNTFKVSSTDLAESVNFLTAIQKQTALNLTDITDALPRIGPIVKQLGGTYKDTAVMMLSMKEAGVPAAQAANAIKSAMASMIAPTTAAKDMFAKFNINLGAIATSTGGNPVKMIQALQQSLQGIEPLARAQLIEKLFGKFQFARVTAMLDNLGKAGSQTQLGFKIAGASAKELSTLIDQEMKIATTSATAKWSRAIEGFKATLYPVGQKFLEIGTIILNIANKIGKAFSGLPSPIKTVLGIFAGLSLFAGPVIMLTGLLANFVGYLLKGVVNLKLLATGGKSFKELLTPEIIASQNAAQLFSSEIAKDVDAVDLLNQAVKQLTITLEGMSGAMSTATGEEMALAAAKAQSAATVGATSYANGLYHVMEKSVYGAFGYGGKSDYAKSKPTTGAFASLPQGYVSPKSGQEFTIQQLNAKLAKSGVAADELIFAMKNYAGETNNASRMFVTSTTKYLDTIKTMTDVNGQTIISEENVEKILAEINIEYENELLSLQSQGITIKDENALLSQITNKIMIQNANLSQNSAEFQRMWAAYNTSTSLTTKAGAGAGGGGRAIPVQSSIYGTGKESVILAGKGNALFLHSYNEEFIKFREKIIADFRAAGMEAGGALEKSLIAQIDSSYAGITTAISKIGNIATVEMRDAGRLGALSFIEELDATVMKNAAESASVFEEAGAADGRAWKAGFNSQTGMVNPGGTKNMRGMGVMAGGMGAMMAGGALQGKSGAAGVAGSLLTNVGMASMVAMMAPATMVIPILAGVAALTLAYKGISSLMAAEKQHQLIAQKAFQSNATDVEFFGDKVLNTAFKINVLKSNIEGVSTVYGGLTPELQKFVDYIDKLPKDDPTKLFVNGLKKIDSLSSIAGNMRTKVASAISIGGLDPAQAQKYVAGLLAAAGKSGQFAAVWKDIQGSLLDAGTATTIMLDKLGKGITETGVAWNKWDGTSKYVLKDYKELNGAQKAIADSMYSLIGTLTSGTLTYDQFQSRLDGIKNSSLNGATGINALRAAIQKSGDKEALSAFDSISASLDNIGHKTAADIAGLIALQNMGITTGQQAAAQLGIKYTGSQIPDASIKQMVDTQLKIDLANNPNAMKTIIEQYKKTMDAYNSIMNSSSNTTSSTNTGGTVALSKLQQLVIANLQEELVGLKKKRDALAAINTELKKQQDFEIAQQNRLNDMKQALVTGDYLKAATIKQDMANSKNQFNQDTASQVQDKTIAALEQRITDLQAGKKVTAAEEAISKAKAKITKSTGGLIMGPGTGTSDSIRATVGFANGGMPINVSNGEYIQKAAAVKKYGVDFMNSINEGTFGNVAAQGNTVYNVTTNVNVDNADAKMIADMATKQTMSQLKTLTDKSNKGNKVRV